MSTTGLMHWPKCIKIQKKTSYFGKLEIRDPSSNGIANRLGSQSLSKLIWKIDLMNLESNWVVHDFSKPLLLGGLPAKSGLLSRLRARRTSTVYMESDYDISLAYGISHWWFKRKELYITRHSAPFDRSEVISHMRILSVVSLKTFSRYGYTLKEIVLYRADYQAYKISEADFKNLHPNDFEEMYLLHLYGKINHLSGADKETEVHKFNDGTLTRILEKLDYMVKDSELFKFNPGMENRIWTEDDKQRSQEFIKLIERRLKIRQIFRSLKRFVSGRLRDINYKLINRTE
ncbi:hypothetical protein Tco_0408946 [Tanacetum coccineum]